jgi:hypothetical protein
MPAQPTSNPSPKSRFLESNDNISKHKRMIESNEYQRGLDFSMLQYQADLALRCSDPNNAHVMGIKLSGVLEFLDVMKRLADSPQEWKSPTFKDHLPEFNTRG